MESGAAVALLHIGAKVSVVLCKGCGALVWSVPWMPNREKCLGKHGPTEGKAASCSVEDVGMPMFSSSNSFGQGTILKTAGFQE